MKTRLLVGGILLLAACTSASRTFDVEIGDEEVCRTFEPQAEQCALTGTPMLRMMVTIEDRGDGEALIYGRSDSSAERVYLAQVPREGRYEVEETTQNQNTGSGCTLVTRTVVALDVAEDGLEGGEEYRVVEEKKCNELKQRRTTRRLREWRGSRASRPPGEMR
jgi:hypothetical protein